MAHYRKRPIAIEAWQFNPDNDEPMPSWLQKALFVWPNAGGVQFENGGSGIKIQTLEGVMAASPLSNSSWTHRLRPTSSTRPMRRCVCHTNFRSMSCRGISSAEVTP